MDKISSEVISIKNLYPCIYKIGDKCFYIGSGLFRECTAEEHELYQEYLTEWQYILENGEEICISPKKLLALFDKIMFRKDEPASFLNSSQASSSKHDQQIQDASFKFTEWIKNLSKESIESLYWQLQEIKALDNYKNGGFYKLPKKLQKVLPECAKG